MWQAVWLLDGHLDFSLQAFERDVSAICQLESENMLPRGEIKSSCGRARAEVDVSGIRRNHRTGRHEGPVDDDVKVSSVVLHGARRGNFDTFGTHRDGHGALNGSTVRWRNEEYPARRSLRSIGAGDQEKDKEKQGEEARHGGCVVWDRTNGAIRMGFREASV